jgi:hypothetical protein
MKYRLFLLALLTLTFTSLDATHKSFAFDRPLKTEAAGPAEIKGTFTLILYGARFPDDLETLAILDIEGDGYYFDPFAPDFDFKLKKGIPAKQALAEAEKFVSFHRSFWRLQLSRILDPKGNIIGYELRPLYNQFVYGRSDVMDVYYWLKEEGRIKVTVMLIPDILSKTRFPGGDGAGPGGGSN